MQFHRGFCMSYLRRYCTRWYLDFVTSGQAWTLQSACQHPPLAYSNTCCVYSMEIKVVLPILENNAKSCIFQNVKEQLKGSNVTYFYYGIKYFSRFTTCERSPRPGNLSTNFTTSILSTGTPAESYKLMVFFVCFVFLDCQCGTRGAYLNCPHPWYPFSNFFPIWK